MMAFGYADEGCIPFYVYYYDYEPGDIPWSFVDDYDYISRFVEILKCDKTKLIKKSARPRRIPVTFEKLKVYNSDNKANGYTKINLVYYREKEA